MITREQLEKQLGLDKYAKQEVDEQINALKAERERFSKEVDNIRQLLEKRENTEISVKQEAETLRKELGKLDKLPKLLDDNISELKNTTEILVSYYNVLNVLIESENDKISIIVKIMIRLNVLLFIIMIVLFFMLGLNLKLIF